MPLEVIIIVFLIVFIVFLALGMNIATSLFASGIIGLILLEGAQVFRLFEGIVGSDIFYSISSYSLSIIPLYILMAQILMKGKIVEDLFIVVYKLAGKRRFVLGAGTVVMGGFLGAVTGSGSAISAALATTTAPELQLYKYSKPYAVSIGAAGGSLAAIIPPSIIMMIYGSLAEVPVGHLFIGSIIPGVLAVGLFILCAYIIEKVSKSVIEDHKTNENPKSTQGEELVEAKVRDSLPAFVFVVVLMIVIFGGIYGGIVTAGEAGGVGAFVTIAGMLIMRRISLKSINDALVQSVKITGMIMIIVMGAQIFGRFMSYAMIPRMIISGVEPFLDVLPVLILLLLFVLFVFGMFIESAAVMVMSVPVLLPILEKAELNLIWFGVMACFVISLGLLTPPLGLSVYTAAGASGCSVEEIFRYTLIFAVAAAVILVPLFIVFPSIITFLPMQM